MGVCHWGRKDASAILGIMVPDTGVSPAFWPELVSVHVELLRNDCYDLGFVLADFLPHLVYDIDKRRTMNEFVCLLPK